jgi:predicted nucleotidyltransferase
VRVGHIEVEQEAIERLCQKYQVQELALFGSALRDDFQATSDVDVLVEYKPGTKRTLFDFVELQEELEDLLGRKVDLVEKACIHPVIADEVISTRRVIYVAPQ